MTKNKEKKERIKKMKSTKVRIKQKMKYFVVKESGTTVLFLTQIINNKDSR